MTALGPFVVSADQAEIDAFRAATGLPPCDAVPATFPMRWLAAPDVREMLSAMLPEHDLVPVHESQMFDYLAPLRCGSSYEMRLDAHRETSPDRLVVAGTIAGEDNKVHVQIETVLRLFSTADKAA